MSTVDAMPYLKCQSWDPAAHEKMTLCGQVYYGWFYKLYAQENWLNQRNETTGMDIERDMELHEAEYDNFIRSCLPY